MRRGRSNSRRLGKIGNITVVDSNILVCRVFKILHQLLTTTDAALFEKVKLALQQLSM